MRPFIRTALLFALLSAVCFAPTAKAGIAGPSREEIQSFLKQPGNGILSPQWERYEEKLVRWQGVVYRVDIQADGTSEVLLKVLPTSHLYDTVLILPPDHPWGKTLKEGQVLRFQGLVTGAVDTVFLKEVHVTLYGAQPNGSSG